MLFSTVFAAVGATGFGFVTDRLGPKRTLVMVLITWLGAILLAAVAVGPWMLLLAGGPIVGTALGATWVVSRVIWWLCHRQRSWASSSGSMLRPAGYLR